ncbi:MAG: VOC family protein [Planctomycetota bacterium]|nr:VOC family protein [Planctomycetota bacterium]
MPTPLGNTHLRVARPTDNLDAVVAFYRDALGLQVVGGFKGHHGIDGAMLGQKGGPYHLEFTHNAHHKVGRAPTQDNLLVFYLPDDATWQATLARLAAAGHKPVKSFNPFWDGCGQTYEDPDGYRVVLVNGPYVQW